MQRAMLTAVLAASLSLAGCLGSDPPSGDAGNLAGDASGGASGGGGPSAVGAPCAGEGIRVMSGCTAPRGTYVPLDGVERDRVANTLWLAMTNAPCWFKQGSSQQYVFYDMLQYTFWGDYADSKSFGTLGAESFGRYEDKDAAVFTMRSESWLFVVHDAQTLTVGKQLNGQPYVELYQAHYEGRCT